MSHPRVDQLRFARAEFLRGLEGLGEDDAVRRLDPMNSISWMVGHMAWHERLVWIERGQGLRMEPVLDAVATGLPASTPPYGEMLEAWRRVVSAVDPFLDGLTSAELEHPLPHDPRHHPPTAGSQLQRVTYHYWSHIGEVSAIRQILGHEGLAQFVGDIDSMAPYRRETPAD